MSGGSRPPDLSRAGGDEDRAWIAVEIAELKGTAEAYGPLERAAFREALAPYVETFNSIGLPGYRGFFMRMERRDTYVATLIERSEALLRMGETAAWTATRLAIHCFLAAMENDRERVGDLMAFFDPYLTDRASPSA